MLRVLAAAIANGRSSNNDRCRGSLMRQSPTADKAGSGKLMQSNQLFRLQVEALASKETDRVGVHLVARANCVFGEKHIERWAQQARTLDSFLIKLFEGREPRAQGKAVELTFIGANDSLHRHLPKRSPATRTQCRQTNHDHGATQRRTRLLPRSRWLRSRRRLRRLSHSAEISGL